MASVASPPAGAPKQRRKLQKPPNKKRNSFFLGRRAGTSLSLYSPSEDNFANKGNVTPKLALPPDLSDAKWSEFLRRSTRANSKESSPLSTPSAEAPPAIVPEFAHLTIQDGRPMAPSNNSSSSSDSSASSSTTRLRRQAKTPVRSIGQLERSRAPPLPRLFVEQRRDSAELLAQQYRDLLRSRNSNFTDEHRDDDDEPALTPRGQELYAAATAAADTSGSSPTSSDNGTLVGFQPDAVFFKPYATTLPSVRASMPPSVLGGAGGAWTQSRGSLAPSAAPTAPSGPPDNLSFQLCLELLTRELSTAVRARQRGGTGTSALQVLMMIEAYERLRGQLLAEWVAGSEEAGQLDAMFDVWLRALYAVHDRLMGEAASRASESDYDAFDMEDFD